MKDDPIPPEDFVSRYCGGATLDEDGNISGASFLLNKNKNEEYLSVNWLEFLQKENHADAIAEIRRVLATKLKLGSTAKLGVLNVKQTQDAVKRGTWDERLARILHRPDEPSEFPDPSHSGLFDTELDEDLVVEILAQVVIDTYTAK